MNPIPIAHAVTIAVTLPGVQSDSSVQNIISGSYIFILSLAGLLAFATIIFAGIKYSVSAGNAGRQSDAKDQILQAFLGVLLLLGASIILYTINPNLVILKLPTLTSLRGTASPPAPAAVPPNAYGK